MNACLQLCDHAMLKIIASSVQEFIVTRYSRHYETNNGVYYSLKVLRNTFVCQNGHRFSLEVHFLPWRSHRAYVANCPECRDNRPITPVAPHIDEELKSQWSKCPYVHAQTGAACKWVGPYEDLRAHIHRIPCKETATDQ